MARSQGKTFPGLLTLFALEGFLGRLAGSSEREVFILKGGVLLAAFNARRPTKDIDFLGLDIDNDTVVVSARIASIAALPRTDGLVLEPEQTRVDVIRDDDEYSGVRVHLVYALATAQIAFHVDVNVGDPVYPDPQEIDLPGLLGGSIRLRGYPMVSVLAEKIVTAMQRGAANTRWRDYADVLILSRDHAVTGDDLHAAVNVRRTGRGAGSTGCPEPDSARSSEPGCTDSLLLMKPLSCHHPPRWTRGLRDVSPQPDRDGDHAHSQPRQR